MARAESESPKTPSSRAFFRAESRLDPPLLIVFLAFCNVNIVPKRHKKYAKKSNEKVIIATMIATCDIPLSLPLHYSLKKVTITATNYK